MNWKVTDKKQAAVVAHHADLISFEDVFYDLHVVQLWNFTQMNGWKYTAMHAALIQQNWNL